MSSSKIGQPTKAEQRSGMTWVQTDRAAHEAWGKLISSAPMAARLMHLLVAHMGEGNAVVASQTVLGELMGRSNRDGKPVHRNTVRKAITRLEDERWIEVVTLGGKGGTLAYVINSRVAWHGSRDQMRYARFSAQVVASESEQGGSIDESPPLRRIPQIMHGEEPLPSGPGDTPPAQQQIEGTEPVFERNQNDETQFRDELERQGQQRIDWDLGNID